MILADAHFEVPQVDRHPKQGFSETSSPVKLGYGELELSSRIERIEGYPMVASMLAGLSALGWRQDANPFRPRSPPLLYQR